LTFSLQAGTDPIPSGASINGSTGVFTWTPTEAQGPGIYEFKVRATDDGTPVLFGETNVKITVNEVNQAPVLEAIGNKSVDEGSALTFTAKAADPDVPANTLAFSLDGAPAGASINATTGAFSWTPADDEPTDTPSDDNTFKVIVKDNGTPQLSDEETITVTVNNVGPVVTVEPDKTGKEGEVIPLKGEFKDPGADDHTWSWEYVEGFNAGATCSITGATTTLTPTIACTDDGVVKVTLTVRDDDTGEGSDYLLLTLSNVAPSATSLNAPTEVNEGTAINLKLDGVTDPSSVDATSLQYSFDCGDGNGYSAFGSSNSASCPTSDNGSRSVGGRVKDKDNGTSDNYTATVIVKNVPPVANAGGPYSGTEGSPISLSGSATDVGTADVISYAWTINSSAIDGGGTCSFNGTANQQNAQVTCTDDSNGGQFTASLIATDDDGGVSVASTAQVTVTNVAPQIATFTKADLTSSPLPSTIIIGGTLNFRATFSDVGSNDSHKGQIDCGTGTYGSATTSSSPYEPSCTFSSIGQKVIKVKVSDDDYGSAEVTHTVTVMYNFAGFSAPVDRPNMMNVSKAGQAIPLKWRLTDALGRPITDLTSVSVQSVGMPCGAYTGTDVLEEYAAGTSGLQNLGDGYYQFNWKTPAGYAGTCKSISLVFGAGGLSYVEGPNAFFTFKK
jgi:Putative Ig domain/PKD domain